MDEAIGYTSNRVCLENINEVRIATQTLLVSDLFDMKDMQICPDCYNAKQNLQRHNLYFWPQSIDVSSKSKAQWQKFLRFLCQKYSGKLGPWIDSNSWKYKTSPDRSHLFQPLTDGLCKEYNFWLGKFEKFQTWIVILPADNIACEITWNKTTISIVSSAQMKKNETVIDKNSVSFYLIEKLYQGQGIMVSDASVKDG